MRKGLTLAQMAIAMQMARYKSTRPEFDLALMALSSEAGLTSNELSWLEVRDVVDRRGRINEFVKVRKSFGSGSLRGRLIPCVADNLIEALRLHLAATGVRAGHLFTNLSGTPMPRSEIQRRMQHIYRLCGFADATGESGRHGFLERVLEGATHDSNYSIRDAQLLLGFAQLSQLVALQQPPARVVALIDFIWEDASASAHDQPAQEKPEATERRAEPASDTAPLQAGPENGSPGAVSGGPPMRVRPATDPRQRIAAQGDRRALHAALRHAAELQAALTATRKSMTHQARKNARH